MGTRRVSDDDLLRLAVTGISKRQIAKEVGMTPTAVTNRFKEPELAQKLAECRRMMLDSVITKLTANTERAVDVLAELLESDNPFVQFNAASKILSMSQDYQLQHDLMQEVERLKEAQREMQESRDASAATVMDYD